MIRIQLVPPLSQKVAKNSQNLSMFVLKSWLFHYFFLIFFQLAFLVKNRLFQCHFQALSSISGFFSLLFWYFYFGFFT